jgi:hypothetical protein
VWIQDVAPVCEWRIELTLMPDVDTGKAGLTYQEALESEEKALKHIASFPAVLQKPLLFLAQRKNFKMLLFSKYEK